MERARRALQFFGLPRAPVAFPGSTMPGSDPSILAFAVPEAGEYAADVTLTRGAVSLAGGSAPASTLTSSGSISLGQVPSPNVIQRIRVDAVGPQQARWTIAIRRVG